VFAKYTVQALLLYLLNPKFSTENVKNCTLISHFASASLTLPTGALPLNPIGGLPSPISPGPVPQDVNPLHCKILGTPVAAPPFKYHFVHNFEWAYSAFMVFCAHWIIELFKCGCVR